MSIYDRPGRFNAQPEGPAGNSAPSSMVNASRLKDQLISEGGRRGVRFAQVTVHRAQACITVAEFLIWERLKKLREELF
jgi:hypothetical protein